LTEEYNCIQLSASSSFFRRTSIKGIEFIKGIFSGEDIRFIANNLILNPLLGILKEAIYYYRKRSDSSSAIQNTEENVKFYTDSKSYLQEMVQMDKGTIEYKIINETGPQNNKTYEVEVYVDNIKYGTGTGRNKKEAEQNAARDAIDKMAG
jgi:hypothetical protein